MTGTGRIVQVGVDHQRSPQELLGRLHAALRVGEACYPLRSRCSGIVRLATCHRLEIYLEDVTTQEAIVLFGKWLGLTPQAAGELAGTMSVRVGAEAAKHLLRVAAGMESAALGEDQIQGQVKAAYHQACTAREAGPLLHRLFHAAFRAGKRVRSETGLKRGGRSLAGSGVTLLVRELGEVADKTVLVVGAGEMGQLAAARLRERGVGRLLVTNRTWFRAQELATSCRGEALPWAWRERALVESHGVICASGAPEPVIAASCLRDTLRSRQRLVVVDLAVPRNVELPDSPIPGLLLVDVDRLARRLAADASRRDEAVRGAMRIVDQELGVWVAWVLARERGEVRRDAGRPGTVAG